MEYSYPKKFIFIICAGWLTIVVACLKAAYDTFALVLGLIEVHQHAIDPVQPGFSTTLIVYAIAFIFILFGKRITKATDVYSWYYIHFLLVSSLAISTYELLRPNYVFGYVMAFLALVLFCTELVMIQLMRSEDFKNGRTLPSYHFAIKSWIIFVVIVVALTLSLPTLENKIYPVIVWKTYQNTEWGFQLSYPSMYSFVDDNENVLGSKHFLIPQQPYEQSGYLSKVVEIMDVVSTSTTAKPVSRGYLQVVLIPGQPKTLDDLNSELKAMIASTSVTYKNSNITQIIQEINTGDETLPAVIYTTATSSIGSVYVFVPPFTLFGKSQPSSLFKIDYAPIDNPAISKIISSFKLIPRVPTDQELYYSAEENKDNFWCDKMTNGEVKSSCYITVRGYPIIDKFPIKLDTILEKNGTASVSSSTIKISTSKVNSLATSSNSWIAFAVNIGDNPWQAINFDAKLANGEKSQSLLTIYWDSHTIGEIDGRVESSSDGLGPWDFGTSSPNSVHVLGFRLDSFASGGTTSATISNISGIQIH